MSLPPSMADFVPCDRLLQKAYWRRRTLIGLVRLVRLVCLTKQGERSVSSIGSQRWM